MPQVSFPHEVLNSDDPFPSPGPLGGVPRFRRYYESFRFPVIHPASLPLRRSAVPRCVIVSLRRPSDTDNRGLESSGCGTPIRTSTWRWQDLPGSWRTPLRACPAHRPRRTPSVRPSSTLGCCLPHYQRRRHPQMNISGLNHAAQALAVYASQRGLPQRHARLASGCWSALPGGVRYPQGPIDRFQFSRILLSQAWPGALVRIVVRGTSAHFASRATRFDLENEVTTLRSERSIT